MSIHQWRSVGTTVLAGVIAAFRKYTLHFPDTTASATAAITALLAVSSGASSAASAQQGASAGLQHAAIRCVLTSHLHLCPFPGRCVL